MNYLDGLHIDWRFVQIYRRGYKLRNLGKRSLVNLNRSLLFKTSTTWKVVQIHGTGDRLGFSLPYLDGSFLDDWWCSGILVPTSYVFLLVLSHCSYSCDEENQVKKNEGKEERTILISTSGFLVTKVFSCRYWPKSPHS